VLVVDGTESQKYSGYVGTSPLFHFDAPDCFRTIAFIYRQDSGTEVFRLDVKLAG
jgi:hypothetical protein